jgi:hypothetical protein
MERDSFLVVQLKGKVKTVKNENMYALWGSNLDAYEHAVPVIEC